MGRTTIYQTLINDLVALINTHIPLTAEAGAEVTAGTGAAADASAAGGSPKKSGAR